MTVMGAFMDAIETGFGFIGFVTVQGLVGWLALMMTGRAFDAVTNTTEASMKDNAVSGGVVIGLTAVGGIILSWLPTIGFPNPFGAWGLLALYVFLVYRAFQLDGVFDVFLFFFIHGVLLMVLHVLGIDRVLRVDIWF